jgi:hypothetical protein
MDRSSPQESPRAMDDEAISRLWAEDASSSLREMTPAQAARRVGEELQFGKPFTVARLHSYPGFLIAGWLLGFLVAVTMLSVGADPNAGPGKPLVLACLAVLLLVCFFMIVFGTKRRVLGGWLARYRDGYVQMLAGDPGPRAVRWASVTEVTVTFRTTTFYAGTAPATTTSVGSFSARPFIGGMAPQVTRHWLMTDALRAAGPRLVNAMIEAYESGKQVAFGSVSIDQNYVALPGLDGPISWADIHAIRMRHVRLGQGGRVVTEVRLSCRGGPGHQKIVISGLPNGIFLPRVIAHAAAQHGVPVRGNITMLHVPLARR